MTERIVADSYIDPLWEKAYFERREVQVTRRSSVLQASVKNVDTEEITVIGWFEHDYSIHDVSGVSESIDYPGPINFREFHLQK